MKRDAEEGRDGQEQTEGIGEWTKGVEGGNDALGDDDRGDVPKGGDVHPIPLNERGQLVFEPDADAIEFRLRHSGVRVSSGDPNEGARGDGRNRELVRRLIPFVLEFVDESMDKDQRTGVECSKVVQVQAKKGRGGVFVLPCCWEVAAQDNRFICAHRRAHEPEQDVHCVRSIVDLGVRLERILVGIRRGWIRRRFHGATRVG